MIIKELTIENFGRHKKIHKVIEGNILGLVGSNGKGKSTVLKAIEWALRGTIEDEDNIRTVIRHYGNEEHQADFASVKMTFSKHGKVGEIMRKITAKGTSSRSLIWDGEPSIKAAGKVDSKLEEILGADKKALGAIVCIAQGEVDKLLTGTYAERRTLFTRLLGLNHLEKGSGIVAKYRETFMQSMQDLSGLLSDAELEVMKASERTELVQKELAEIPDLAWDMTSVRELYRNAIELDQTESDLIRKKEELQHSESNLSIAKKDMGDGKDLDRVSELRELEKSLVNNEVTRTNFNRAIHAQSLWDQEYKQWEKAQSSVTEAEAKNVILAKYDFEGSKASIEGLRNKIQSANELSRVNQQLAKVMEDLPNIIEQGKELKTQCDNAKVEFDTCNKLFSSLNTKIQLYDIALQSDNCNCPLCDTDGFDKAHIQEIAEVERIQLKEVSNNRDQLQNRLTELEFAILGARDQYASANQLKQTRETEADELFQRCEGLAVNTAEEELKGREEEYQEATQMKQSLDSAKAVLEQSLGRSNQAHANFKKIAEEIGHPGEMDFSKLLAELTVPYEGQLQSTRDELSRLESIESRYHKYTQAVALAQEELVKAEARKAEFTDLVNTWIESADVTQTTKAIINTHRTSGSILKNAVQLTINEMNSKFIEPRSQVEGSLKEALLHSENCDKRVKAVKEQMEDQKYQQQVAEELLQVKEALQPEGIARTYMDYKFQQIAEITQDHLTRLETDFMVMASDDVELSFSFVRTDDDTGSIMPQSKLSGGQKVRLSIAFLLAVQELIIPEVGLLILDEPTTHVDEEGKASLRNVFMTLASECRATESQIIVCDHSPVLISSFEDSIELK